MQRKEIFKLWGVIFIAFFSKSNLFSKGSSVQIQQLYTKINNELLSIRKEYPNAQPTVYTALDQVCKMYSISKNVIERKKILKTNLTSEKNLLRVKNLSLSQKLKETEEELIEIKQNATSTSKSAEQKDLTILQLKKEHEQLIAENKKLNEEKRQLLKAQNSPEQQNISPSNKSLSENQHEDYLHKLEKANLKTKKLSFNDFQNLSLTSTSDPISPL